jgi:hypothetical protein
MQQSVPMVASLGMQAQASAGSDDSGWVGAAVEADGNKKAV